MRFLSPKLIEVLRGSLQRVQSAIDLDPADPALQRLKGSILRSIAELEIRKSATQPHPRIVQIISPPEPAESPEPGELVPRETDAA